MKRKFILILGAALLLFAACGSTPTQAPASANTGVSFDGFWQTPNNDALLWIKENAFVLQTKDGEILNTGVFTHTDSQFALDVGDGSYAYFNYTAASKNIRVTSDNNTWANGIWIKRDDISVTSDHPLVGYWEQKTEKGISILFITPFGWGEWFTCDLEYKLTNRNRVRYDEDNHSEFRVVYRLGEGVTTSLPFKYVFDGEDLLFGMGVVDDISKYDRYIKK